MPARTLHTWVLHTSHSALSVATACVYGQQQALQLFACAVAGPPCIAAEPYEPSGHGQGQGGADELCGVLQHSLPLQIAVPELAAAVPHPGCLPTSLPRAMGGGLHPVCPCVEMRAALCHPSNACWLSCTSDGATSLLLMRLCPATPAPHCLRAVTGAARRSTSACPWARRARRIGWCRRTITGPAAER